MQLKARLAHKGVILLSLAFLGMTACSNHFDALVTNPCDEPVEMGFWGGSLPTQDQIKGLIFNEIPAQVTNFRLPNSVAAPHGWPGGSAVLRVGSDHRFVDVPATDTDPVRIEIPESLCSILSA